MSGHGPLGFDDDDDDREREGPQAPDEPPSSSAPPPRPRTRRPLIRNRYGWFLALALFVFVVYVTVNSLGTEGPGSRGVSIGQKLPPFALPLALSDLEGDANVALAGKTSESAGTRPACEVRGPKVLNICQVAERGPVVLAFLATRSSTCIDELDRLERVRRRFPEVQFAAVAIRGDRERLRKLIRARGWGFPVGYDSDGVLANLYGVAVCPQITFTDRHGKVVSTAFGAVTETDLETRIRSAVTAK